MAARPTRRLLPATLGVLAAFSLACMHPGTTDRRTERIESTVDQILEGQEVTHEKLDELIELARAQGTGEITLFYPWARSRLPRGERDRLVRFLDHLAHEAHGREVLLVAIGVSSDWNTETRNVELSERRAHSPRPVIARHLVHVTHKWHEIDGSGSMLVPPDARGKTWRHVRIIAVFDEEQLPDEVR